MSTNIDTLVIQTTGSCYLINAGWSLQPVGLEDFAYWGCNAADDCLCSGCKWSSDIDSAHDMGGLGGYELYIIWD